MRTGFKKLRSALNSALLELINEFGEALADYSIFLSYQRAALKHGMRYARELSAIHSAAELKRRIAELKRQGFLQARRMGKRMAWSLTNDGLLLARLTKVSQADSKGTYSTIIIFDIPESERRSRRQVRFMLTEMGFKRLQHSVWARRGDVYAEVKEVIAILGVGSWLTVLRTTDI